MSVVVIGLSHRSAPVELRERFAFAESKIPEALQQLRAAGLSRKASFSPRATALKSTRPLRWHRKQRLPN